MVCTPEQLLAVVTDGLLDVPVTQFSPDNIEELADFIEQNLLEKHEKNISISVNNKPVPLNPFVRELMSKTLLGMVSTLKGVGKIRKLDVWLRQGARRSNES